MQHIARRTTHKPPSLREPIPPPPVIMPSAAWQAAASAFAIWAEDRLWDEADETGLDYLVGRGLREQTLPRLRFGYNPRPLTRSRAKWGLPPHDAHGDELYIPAGIVLPTWQAGQVIRCEVRQLPTGKYTITGGANLLWGVERIRRDKPVMLVKGQINGATVLQEAGDLITPIAMGTYLCGRRIAAVAPLIAAPRVLISTDTGTAGEDAAAWWLHVLGERAMRWRPLFDDVNTMHTTGCDVRQWVQEGLK